MVYMYYSFPIHSSADGHLGCFHVLAMINSAAMNTGVHVSLSDLVSLVCMPRSGIAGSYGFTFILFFLWASQVALVVKNPPAHAGDIRDAGLIPGLGRSSGGGNSKPLQYFCLENPMDRSGGLCSIASQTVGHDWSSLAPFLSKDSFKSRTFCSQDHPSTFFPLSRMFHYTSQFLPPPFAIALSWSSTLHLSQAKVFTWMCQT